ncbi:MAG: hypothetical protein WD904_06045 [Dehalococcoidia bacterium]
MALSIRQLVLMAMVAIAISLGACGGDDDANVDLPDNVDVDVEDFGSPTGYWEGEGTAYETPIDDGVRTLTRDADFEFWFSLNSDGHATGEITLTYDSVLTVDGLPNLSLPGVGGVSAAFDPEVGGEITDEDPTRVFPLVGLYTEGDGLILAMVPGEEPDPIEFTIRADPGVSAGFDVGGAGSVGIDGEGSGTIAYVIDMTPFTPFGSADFAEVEKRPGGPFAAHFEFNDDTYAIEWSAVQQTSDTQTVDITDEMQDALDSLLE